MSVLSEGIGENDRKSIEQLCSIATSWRKTFKKRFGLRHPDTVKQIFRIKMISRMVPLESSNKETKNF